MFRTSFGKSLPRIVDSYEFTIFMFTVPLILMVKGGYFTL